MSNLEEIKKLTAELGKIEMNLKEERQIMAFLLDESTDGFFDWNVETGDEYLSDKFKKQLGFEPHEMENRPEAWQAICNPEDVGEIYEKVLEHFSGKTDGFEGLLRFTHKNGGEVVVFCRGKVIKRSETGAPLRVVGTHKLK